MLLSRGSRSPRISSAVLVVGLLAAPGDVGCDTPAQSVASAPAAESPRWLGLDGSVLPFSSTGELLAFLRDAEIVEVEAMPTDVTGVTGARRVTLASGETVARAAFHEHHIVRTRQRLVDGTLVVHFRDTYLSQVAAWEMARMLGIENTPPTVVRVVGGATGSLQLWIEESITERERRARGLLFPDRIRAYRQVYDMDIFDALINNRDRSQGNFLWTDDWRLWMVDHTRAFGRERKIVKPRSVRRCSRRLWQALQELDAREVDERLEPYMGRPERSALMARRDEIVRRLEEKIAAEGESQVLFSYEDPS